MCSRITVFLHLVIDFGCWNLLVIVNTSLLALRDALHLNLPIPTLFSLITPLLFETEQEAAQEYDDTEAGYNGDEDYAELRETTEYCVTDGAVSYFLVC